MVAEQHSVLDNVWLGGDGLLRSGVPARARPRAGGPGRVARAPDLLARRSGALAERAAGAGIARALLREPRILILDEATSALDVATRDRLFAILNGSAEGVGIVFISHRMDEIEEIGDLITVMRSGETVATLGRGQGDRRELVG